MITVVSSAQDAHAAVVMERLLGRGAQVLLLDLSEFPERAELTITVDGQRSCGLYQSPGSQGQVDLSASRVVWWRRPQPFTVPSELETEVDRSFAYTECQAAFSGLWLTLDACWINHPQRDEEAARKVYQLEVAREIGFRVPQTCVTNSPETALAFVQSQGAKGTVYKAFSGTEEAWRETRILKEDELRLIATVRYAPVIFQEYVPAQADLRVTIVGDDIFAAAIYSQETSYKVDYRMTMDDAPVRPYTLPGPVQALLHAYMERLGLVYGAVDMRVTPEGDYVFLEINPSGQWLFVEHRTGQPITDSLIELMLRHDEAGAPPVAG